MATDCRSRPPKQQFISHVLLLGTAPGMARLRLGPIHGSDGFSRGYDRYGLPVPTVVDSPYSKPDLCHTPCTTIRRC
jgi:hypothetical protein